MAGGPKQLVWLIKQWFERNYGDARREDTLQDLIRQFNELHPGDVIEVMLYIGKVDSLNTCLDKIEERYMKSDPELIIATLTKIPDNKDGKTSVWGPFQAEYRKEGAMANTRWLDFKNHLTQEWKQIGAPSGGEKPVNKALNIHTPGSEYSPFPCHYCHQKGHKAVNCPDRLAGKPKTKKNGNKGGKGGKKNGDGARGKPNKKKKDLSEIECYNCHEKGHYKNKCPKLKDAKAANVEVALNVRVVNRNEDGVCSSSSKGNTWNEYSHCGQVSKRVTNVAKKMGTKNPKCGQMIDP